MSKAAELAALIGSQTALSNRNLIINGAMQVDQRNTTVTTSAYSCDRWFVNKTNTDQLVFAADQDTTSPDGFSNSLKVAVTTAETALASDELFYIRYQIEGQDLQHLEYGTSSAKSVTLSFWVRSSLTGKYSVLFYGIDTTRSNLQSLTINTADTWEYKTITIDGDTTGSIDNDNGSGFQFYITLAAGTDYAGTPHSGWGAYSATDDFAFSDQVDFSAQTGTFYITGVQLEVGEQATPFEHRSYADELARCQRYYFRINEGVVYQRFAVASCANTNNAQATITAPVTMRATPSVHTTGTAGDYAVFEAGTVHALTSLPSINSTGASAESVNISCTSTGNYSAGNAGEFVANNDASVFFALSAEL